MRHLNPLFKKISLHLPKLLVISLLFGDELLLVVLPLAGISFPPLIQNLLLGAFGGESLKIMVEKGGAILLNLFCESLPISR